MKQKLVDTKRTGSLVSVPLIQSPQPDSTRVENVSLDFKKGVGLQRASYEPNLCVICAALLG